MGLAENNSTARFAPAFRGGGLLTAILLLASAPAESADAIAGRVWLRHDGRLAPLAKVLIVARDAVDVVAVTRSDAAGRYLLRGPFRGRLKLSARRPGYLSRSGSGAVGADITLDCSSLSCGPLDFEFIRGGVVTGRVEDDLGEPVERAQIYLTAQGDESVGSRRSNGRSDDRGRFRIAGIAPGDYRIRAYARYRGSPSGSYQSEEVDIEFEPGEERNLRLTIRAEPSSGFTVSGVVSGVDLQRPGLHSVTARLIRRSGNSSRLANLFRRQLTPDGAFSFERFREGYYLFSYQLRGQGRGARVERISLAALDIDGPRQALALRAGAAATVEGRVAPPAGELEARIAIGLRSKDLGVTEYRTVSQPNFDFTFGRLLPGSYQIFLARPETLFLAAVEREGKPLAGADLRVEAGETQRLRLTASGEFARIAGRAKAPPGSDGTAPAAHSLVALKGPRGVRSERADQNGGFVFERVVPGEYAICAWPASASADPADAETWRRAGPAARSFAVEAGSEIEIELTAYGGGAP